MRHDDAPGLTANWLNAWLAAIGITILLPDTRLSWTPDPQPHAQFEGPESAPSLATRLADAFPKPDQIESYAISRNQPGLADFTQQTSLEAFQDRAGQARATGDYTLGAAITDLGGDANSPLRASPFNPPAPKGLTLHDRLRACRHALELDVAAALETTLERPATRIKSNGLGFDYTRIQLATDPTGDKWVDPAIECLAFFGLCLLPIRGDGNRAVPRGWTDRASQPGSFRWPTWTIPLSSAGIDGLLDRFWNSGANPSATAVYETIPYSPTGTADPTRGYGSRRC